MYKNYLKQIIISLLLFSFPIGSNWLFLYNQSELMPIEEVVEKQQSSKEYCIVGLATRNQGYYYKREMYRYIKPTVLVLGSSRVMQFRQDFFSSSMMNAGGAMSSINEGFSYIKEVLAEHVPEVIILGLDYWWFNENAAVPSDDIKPPIKLSHRISLRSYLLPYKWLWDKKISFSDYIKMVNPLNIFYKNYEKGIGVDGFLNKNGFAPDGSYVYTKTVTGQEPNIDDKFALSFANIEQGGARFEYGDRVNDIHFAHWLMMLKTIKEKGSKVIVFIPPLAPSVVAKMNDYQAKFSFIADLRNRLSQAGIEYYDFHDPNVLATSDCEFIDGIHGGDVAYAKILAFMANKTPALSAHLNSDYMNNVTQSYANLAMIPRKNLSNVAEVDFLHIGCTKLNLSNEV